MRAAVRMAQHAGGERLVDRLADFMRIHPERRVAIEGFTDSVGNAGYNQELSERRANAVRRALTRRNHETQGRTRLPAVPESRVGPCVSPSAGSRRTARARRSAGR
jgi:outer membrane protein OmpA-like peptidoglycan-associated protein